MYIIIMLLCCCGSPFLNASDHYELSGGQMTIAGLKKAHTAVTVTRSVTESDIECIFQDSADFISKDNRVIPNENVVSFLVQWFNFPAQEDDRKEIFRLNENKDSVAQSEMQQYFDVLLVKYESLLPDWK
ncbi:MAG: hypothetical protein WD055_03720 [Candidatus Dependentiae bacterium]